MSVKLFIKTIKNIIKYLIDCNNNSSKEKKMIKEENDSDKQINKKVKPQLRHSKTSKFVFKFSQSIKNEDIESEEKIGRKDIKIISNKTIIHKLN